MSDLKAQFTEIETKLEEYIAIGNKDGFYAFFINTVVEEWEGSTFYENDIQNTGYDISIFAKKTQKRLGDEVKNYEGFIFSNTGNNMPTFNSGAGMKTESHGEWLQERFGEKCVELLDKLIVDAGIVVNGEVITNYYELCDVLANDKTVDADTVCFVEDLGLKFGAIGWRFELYHEPNIIDATEDSTFADWTLEMFKKEQVELGTTMVLLGADGLQTAK